MAKKFHQVRMMSCRLNSGLPHSSSDFECLVKINISHRTADQFDNESDMLKGGDICNSGGELFHFDALVTDFTDRSGTGSG